MFGNDRSSILMAIHSVFCYSVHVFFEFVLHRQLATKRQDRKGKCSKSTLVTDCLKYQDIVMWLIWSVATDPVEHIWKLHASFALQSL